jgi:hypothetical protein
MEINCRIPVHMFAEEMEKVLKKHDTSKHGWSAKEVSQEFLKDKLREEIGEWLINPTNPKELVDIANVAMMLWTRQIGIPGKILY